MSNTLAAIYVRLSREDLDNEVSMSVVNQINGLKEYCERNEYKIFNIYVDDGYSGGNLARPSFRELMKDMQNEKFNTIVIKDLSRLGRNYLDIGNLLENVLPLYNIRLISVSDNYDSNDHEDDGTIIIRSVVNDYFLKEFRRKSRESIMRRSKTSTLATTGCYGYKRKDRKTKELIIDEDAATIVRLIFELYLEGKPYTEITNILNNMHVPTPAYQHIINNGNNKYRVKAENYYIWNNTMFNKIINNIEYTGVMVNRRRILVDGKVKRNNNPDILENYLPPIISKETYDKAQIELKKRTTSIRRDNTGLRLKKFAYCDHCNAAMVFNNKVNSYCCPKCSNRIKADVLHELVFMDAKNTITEYLNNKEEFIKTFVKNKLGDRDAKQNDEYKNQKKNIDKLYLELFEKKFNGEITNEEYQEQRRAIPDNRQDLQIMINGFENRKYDEKLINKTFEEFTNLIKTINADDKLDFISKVVSKVYITIEKNVKIMYKFDVELNNKILHYKTNYRNYF